MYSHRGAYLNALAEVLHSEHTPASVYLWTLRCSTATAGAPWGVTAIGGRHVCVRAVRGDRIWQLIEARRRPT